MKVLLSILALCAILVAFGLTTSQADPIPEGGAAPGIKVIDQDGKEVVLADVYKKGLTLVYFYPKADTPGCTKQACSLRDAFTELTAKGVTVIGASTDKPADQKAFKDKFKLPFTLIADEKGDLAKAFGVSLMRLGMATRQCFLVNKEGKIIYRNTKAPTDQQAAEILQQLQTLKQ
jgi:thioredoxin-dependent peroxiredoxin